MAATNEPPVARGLEGVVVADTALSAVDGQAGRLIYRGYDAAELVARSSFEAIWYLLYHGALPDGAQLATFRRRLLTLGQLTAAEQRRVPQGEAGDLVASLRTAVSALAAARGLQPWLYRRHEDVVPEALGLAAALPQLIQLLAGRQEPGAPGASLGGGGYAADYLGRMPGARTDPEATAALDRYLALTVDHGLNASTFAVRVVASTGADVGAAIVAGLGALSGPLHGGAPIGVLDMLDQIGDPARASGWLERQVRAGRRIMGFGHRVYRTEDPRARSLKAVALAHGGSRAELALAVEQAADETLARLKPGRDLHPNVEFWAAVVLEQCGIPRSFFTATFACSRIVGWTAHYLEQTTDNRIIRPMSRYVGPEPA